MADTTNPAELPHDNYGPHVNGAVWTLTGLAGVFMGLRMYCKHIRDKTLWWDDYILIASFIALIAQSSLLSVDTTLGFGRHSWDVKDWESYLFWANVTGVTSIIAAAWSKTSFAVLLLRFTDGWMRRLVWAVIISVNLFLGLSAVFTYAQCSPVRRLWDSQAGGSCWNPQVIITYNSFSSAWSGAMDILLALLPWRIINRRSLNHKERLGVLIAMSMGVFAGATSIGKTGTLQAISNPDVFSSIALMIMATAETAITIMAASIPFLRVLVRNTMREPPPSEPGFLHCLSPSNQASPALPDSGHGVRRNFAGGDTSLLSPSTVMTTRSGGSSILKPLPDLPKGSISHDSWFAAEEGRGGVVLVSDEKSPTRLP